MSTRLTRHHAGWLVVASLLLGSGCGDDDGLVIDPNQHDASVDAGVDAGKTPVASAKLARPELPRPPKQGLPAELRPPR